MEKSKKVKGYKSKSRSLGVCEFMSLGVLEKSKKVKK
jgi:hypothetical protein